MEAALSHFAIDVAGLTCLDAGLSTGGFTDCLLQNGAAKVYGVDVGFGQVRRSGWQQQFRSQQPVQTCKVLAASQTILS